MSDDRVATEPAEAPDNRGPAIIAHGALNGGFKFIGPFETIDAAIKWYGTSFYGYIKAPVTIALLEKPDVQPKAEFKETGEQ